MTTLLAAGLITGSPLLAIAQAVDVSVRVEVAHQGTHAPQSSSDVVVWLSPLQTGLDAAPHQVQEYTLTQKDKMFLPHVLVVPVGSSVNFPNLDPFFHNVFSLFNGKRFDLGLYEAHTHRTVKFDREGVSYIFCNIHPNMGAVIVSLSTPYYAVSAPDGTIVLRDVPPGRYRLHFWAENVAVDRLNDLSRTVDLNAQSNHLGVIHLDSSGDMMKKHENKFGEPYTPQTKKSY